MTKGVTLRMPMPDRHEWPMSPLVHLPEVSEFHRRYCDVFQKLLSGESLTTDERTWLDQIEQWAEDEDE
jgi:hypothetical protein